MNIVSSRTLRSELQARAQAHPEKLFLLAESPDGAVRTWSFGAFDADVNRLAHGFQDLGVQKGDKVNVHLPNCAEFLLAWFALARIGAVMVPTNVASTEAELEYLVDHSESVLTVAQAREAELVARLRSRCSRLRGGVFVDGGAETGGVAFAELLASGSPVAPDAAVSPEDEAAILYTSGTTARPKGVLITHANYLWGGELLGDALRFTADDRALVVLPYFHANSQYYMTMPALVCGGSLAVMPRFSASRYFEQAARYEATIGSLFAAPMRMLLNQPERPADRQHRLRLAVFAQNITAAQLDEWHRRFRVPIRQLYGMTETIGIPLFNPLSGEHRNLTMGRPTLPYTLRVVDADGGDVPAGTVGQLLVRGEPGVSLMKGYFKNPEATAAALRGGWLATGDNVVVDADGFFTFVDRGKDLIRRGAENISSTEVEAVLNQHPAVYESVVVGVPDPIYDEAVHALVIRKPDAAVTAEELIAWCAARLTKFKVPQTVEFRETFPRTSVGKIQKHLIRREVTGG
ncbi:MAG: AMP-binding protein [Chloroflexi bacterium]|nr:AMP-binding protein [Chloroflexota bacterium]